MPRLVKILASLVLSVSLVGCGGGGGTAGSPPAATTPPAPPPPPPPAPPPPPPPTTPVVYLATEDDANVANLYVADADNPGSAVQLNSPLPAGASISEFLASPDESLVAYIADQDTVGKFELYVVDIANPGVSIRLSPTATPTNADVQEFLFSPDGSRIAYISDQDTVGTREQYLVDISNPGTTTKLNGQLVANGMVGIGSVFTPDGTRLVYAADQDTDGLFELYIVALDTPGVSTKLNPAFPAFTELKLGHKISPDNNWLVYRADQDFDDVTEAYLVDLSNPGSATKVNPAYNGERDVCVTQFSPDSQSIVYCADEDTDDKLELYLVSISALGVSTKLNPELVPDGDVRESDWSFNSDGSSVFYRADQDVDEQRELYRVDLSSPGVSTKMNAPMIALGDVFSYEISPDGLSVAYRADQATNAIIELYEVELSAPAVSTVVHPALLGGGTESFRYSSDGARLVFVGEQDITGRDEIYSVDVTDLGASTKLNSPLVTGGQVIDIVVP